MASKDIIESVLCQVMSRFKVCRIGIMFVELKVSYSLLYEPDLSDLRIEEVRQVEPTRNLSK